MNTIDLLDSPIVHHPRERERYGHAAPPGTGPAGESCGTCAHYCLRTIGSRMYSKCGVIPSRQTHGKNTDIFKNDPACAVWEGKPHA